LAVINGSQDATALVGIAELVVGVQDVIEGEWWRCPDPDCVIGSWVEQIDAIGPRAALTERTRARIAAMVNGEGWSIAAAAYEFGVGRHTANGAVAEYTDPVIDDPARLDGVVAIGVDEKRFLNATVEHRTEFTTQIVDLDRHRVLDVIAGRSRHVLDTWLGERGDEWCAQIELATLDHRGRKHDPLYRARRVLLTAYERLSDERLAWMFEMLDAGDPDGEVGAAVLTKELLREVYSAVDEAHARRRLIVFFQQCADADVPELQRLARTPDRWADLVFAYHRTAGASNGRVENVYMLAEKIRRNAHGFTNHDNYQRRLIARLGIKWPTVPTRRIRGRQTHAIA